MNTELEFRDSDVRAMRFSGADLVIDIQQAIVYPAAEEVSLLPGTYQQPVILTFLAATIMGKLASLLYSSVWFAISHPLIWGIYSLPLRKPEAVGALLFVGLIWGLAYQRTGSLRWCVAGHMLANLLGLAALVLLNMYDPTIR